MRFASPLRAWRARVQRGGRRVWDRVVRRDRGRAARRSFCPRGYTHSPSPPRRRDRSATGSKLRDTPAALRRDFPTNRARGHAMPSGPSRLARALCVDRGYASLRSSRLRRNTCVPGLASLAAALARTHEGRAGSTHLPKARALKRTHIGVNSASAFFRCRLSRLFVPPSREVCCKHDSITVVEKNCVAMLSAAVAGVYRRKNAASDSAEHSASRKSRRLFQSGTPRVASTNLVSISIRTRRYPGN